MCKFNLYVCLLDVLDLFYSKSFMKTVFFFQNKKWKILPEKKCIYKNLLWIMTIVINNHNHMFDNRWLSLVYYNNRQDDDNRSSVTKKVTISLYKNTNIYIFFCTSVIAIKKKLFTILVHIFNHHHHYVCKRVYMYTYIGMYNKSIKKNIYIFFYKHESLKINTISIFGLVNLGTFIDGLIYHNHNNNNNT